MNKHVIWIDMADCIRLSLDFDGNVHVNLTGEHVVFMAEDRIETESAKILPRKPRVVAHFKALYGMYCTWMARAAGVAF